MYTFPCSPLLAASSALLSMFSMCARLSALIFLFTVRSAFQYFFLYLSFGLFELDSTNFLFGGSPVLDGVPGCDPLFLFFCRRPKKDSLVWVYAVLTWSHMVLIPVVSGSTLVSCKYWGTTDSPFMDLQRRILTTEAKQEARWEEHFSEVLNRPPPATKADVQDPEADLDLNRHHERKKRSWQPSDP